MTDILQHSSSDIRDFQGKRVIIHPRFPEPNRIAEAARIIRNGGVVVFPTRCLYGLGVNAFDEAAVQRIYQIKQRSEHKPILALIHRMSDLECLVLNVPDSAMILMKKYWPGKLTIVFEARPSLPPGLTAGTGKIGVRFCEHPVPAALITAAGTPMTGTSANISREPGCSDISDLEPSIIRRADFILDAGPLPGGAGSTVVDVTGKSPLIIREGVVRADEILSLL